MKQKNKEKPPRNAVVYRDTRVRISLQPLKNVVAFCKRRSEGERK